MKISWTERPVNPEITRENIHLYKDRILEKLHVDRPDFKLNELKSIFQRLKALQIPFIVAAGNSGAAYVNIFSLMPGVISVGSMNLDGSKRVTSADNALVTMWRKGSFVSEAVEDGVDFNSDGRADFPKTVLSSGRLIAPMFESRLISEAVSEVTLEHRVWSKKAEEMGIAVPNAALNSLSPVQLYLVEDLVTLGTVTPGTAKHFLSSGKYAYKAPDGSPPRFFFTDDGKGRIVFDPLKNGSRKQRIVLSGTSFAAPSVCK